MIVRLKVYIPHAAMKVLVTHMATMASQVVDQESRLRAEALVLNRQASNAVPDECIRRFRDVQRVVARAEFELAKKDAAIQKHALAAARAEFELDTRVAKEEEKKAVRRERDRAARARKKAENAAPARSAVDREAALPADVNAVPQNRIQLELQACEAVRREHQAELQAAVDRVRRAEEELKAESAARVQAETQVAELEQRLHAEQTIKVSDDAQGRRALELQLASLQAERATVAAELQELKDVAAEKQDEDARAIGELTQKLQEMARARNVETARLDNAVRELEAVRKEADSLRQKVLDQQSDIGRLIPAAQLAAVHAVEQITANRLEYEKREAEILKEQERQVAKAHQETADAQRRIQQLDDALRDTRAQLSAIAEFFKKYGFDLDSNVHRSLSELESAIIERFMRQQADVTKDMTVIFGESKALELTPKSVLNAYHHVIDRLEEYAERRPLGPSAPAKTFVDARIRSACSLDEEDIVAKVQQDIRTIGLENFTFSSPRDIKNALLVYNAAIKAATPLVFATGFEWPVLLASEINAADKAAATCENILMTTGAAAFDEALDVLAVDSDDENDLPKTTVDIVTNLNATIVRLRDENADLVEQYMAFKRKVAATLADHANSYRSIFDVDMVLETEAHILMEAEQGRRAKRALITLIGDFSRLTDVQIRKRVEELVRIGFEVPVNDFLDKLTDAGKHEDTLHAFLFPGENQSRDARPEMRVTEPLIVARIHSAVAQCLKTVEDGWNKVMDEALEVINNTRTDVFQTVATTLQLSAADTARLSELASLSSDSFSEAIGSAISTALDACKASSEETVRDLEAQKASAAELSNFIQAAAVPLGVDPAQPPAAAVLDMLRNIAALARHQTLVQVHVLMRQILGVSIETVFNTPSAGSAEPLQWDRKSSRLYEATVMNMLTLAFRLVSYLVQLYFLRQNHPGRPSQADLEYFETEAFDVAKRQEESNTRKTLVVYEHPIAQEIVEAIERRINGESTDETGVPYNFKFPRTVHPSLQGLERMIYRTAANLHRKIIPMGSTQLKPPARK